MSTVSVPKSKPCNRCGEQIIYNSNSSFFESLAYPKYQHCCKLACNKAGCGGSIYFSKLCPVNPETGRPRPLDFPVPQIDPNNSAQMIWVVHVHKNNVAADSVPTNETTKPTFPEEVKAIAPSQAADVKPLAPGQENLVAHIPVESSNSTAKNPVAEAANQDAQAAILTTLNQINQRIGALEKYFNDVVPVITGLIEVMNNVVPKLNVITGKIAEGSIKNASDLVAHHLEQ
jgi:hypothetical protein